SKRPPPADDRAQLPPVEETQMQPKFNLPGVAKLTRDVDGSEESKRLVLLCGDLLQFVVDRGLHLLVAASAATKNTWISALEQAHNHILHAETWPHLGDLVFTPLESYHPYPSFLKGNKDNAQQKFRKLILDTAEHFKQRYDTKQSANEQYLPDRREELGKKIIRERAQAEKAKNHQAAAKKVANNAAEARKQAAETYMGLVPQGRGVTAPSGVDLTGDVLEGLAALGSHTASYTGTYYFYFSSDSEQQQWTLIYIIVSHHANFHLCHTYY
ncbi:MAG: hypothetical protein GWQ05_03110, partial [Verrucomicrobiaceae bacterium]|nr:hypothetical protein [Verrucomicrobiaceae bacterium]